MNNEIPIEHKRVNNKKKKDSFFMSTIYEFILKMTLSLIMSSFRLELFL